MNSIETTRNVPLAKLRRIRSILALMLVGLVPAAGCSTPTDNTTSRYPSRPIKIIVPFTAGGGSDTFARIIKKAIEDHHLLDQPLVIINVSGGGATIGSRRVKNARPDGYTALFLHDAIVMSKYAGNVSYGPEAFDAVAATGQQGTVIAVTSDSKYADLQEVLEDARLRPERVSFACNLGTPTHFGGLLLEEKHEGAKFNFVQTGDGAQRFHALKGGHVDVTLFSVEEYARFRAGGIRAVAFLGEERNPAIADVPTAREQGCDVVSSITQFWWFPMGTPTDRRDHLANALKQAMQTDEVREALAEVYADPLFVEGEALESRIAALNNDIASVDPRDPIDLPNVPVIITTMVVLLSLVVLVRSLRSATSLPEKPQAGDAELAPPQTALAAASVALIMLYVLAMAAGWIGFRAATIGFVLILGLMLSRLSPRHLPWIGALSLLLGLGLFQLFTQVFVIDLP